MHRDEVKVFRSSVKKKKREKKSKCPHALCCWCYEAQRPEEVGSLQPWDAGRKGSDVHSDEAGEIRRVWAHRNWKFVPRVSERLF